MHQQALQNVVSSFQVHPSHSPGFVHVRHASFRQLTALPLEPFAAVAFGPPPVGVYLLLFIGFSFPLPRASVRLGDVASAADLVQILQHRSTVVPLVRHGYFDAACPS